MNAPARKFAALAAIEATDLSLLADLDPKAQRVRAGQHFLEFARTPLLLIEGWVCTVRVLHDGRRQMLSVALPGDLILAGNIEPPSVASLTFAITNARIADATKLWARATEAPRGELAKAWERAAMLDHGFLLDQIVRLGCYRAYERIAHFFLEMRSRLWLAGSDVADGFILPFTQDAIAEAVGLSTVHVNRQIRYLKEQGILEQTNGHLTVRNADQLQRVVRFDDRAKFLAESRKRCPVSQ